jgi:hypothetical protein
VLIIHHHSHLYIMTCTKMWFSWLQKYDYKQIIFIIYVIFVVASVKMAQTMSFIWMYGLMNVVMKVMFWCSDCLYILNAMLIPWTMFATSNLQIIIHCCFYSTFFFILNFSSKQLQIQLLMVPSKGMNVKSFW